MKVVISVGGSIIVPNKVDHKFLREFESVIFELSRRHKIVLVCGGGRTARVYISVLEEEGSPEYIRDLVGIDCTRLNARLVSSFFGFTNKEIPVTLEEVSDMLSVFRVVVCGGLGPGRTSDGTAASVADYISADLFINMTNVNGLYDRDPNKFKGAKFIPKISYRDFSNVMLKVKEKPGQHFVLDSFASHIIEGEKIKTIILKGTKNLKAAVQRKKFIGTVIS